MPMRSTSSHGRGGDHDRPRVGVGRCPHWRGSRDAGRLKRGVFAGLEHVRDSSKRAAVRVAAAHRLLIIRAGRVVVLVAGAVVDGGLLLDGFFGIGGGRYGGRKGSRDQGIQGSRFEPPWYLRSPDPLIPSALSTRNFQCPSSRPARIPRRS